MKKFAALSAAIPAAIVKVQNSWDRDTKKYDITPVSNLLSAMRNERNEYKAGMYQMLEFYIKCDDAKPHLLAKRIQTVLANLESMTKQFSAAIEVCSYLDKAWYDNVESIGICLDDSYEYMRESENDFWYCIYHTYCESQYRNLSWKSQSRAKALLVKTHNEFAKRYDFPSLMDRKQESEMLAWAMRVRKAC